MPRKPGIKSEFVRAQPASLSPAEVVARAKKEGINLSEALVYLVRGKGKSGATNKATKSTGTAVKATQKKAVKATPKKAAPPSSATGDKLSPHDYIRAQPASLNAQDVAKKGKTEGYNFKPGMVYYVRAADAKTSGSSKAAAAPKAVPSASGKVGPSDFIRAQPLSMTAKQVEENGAAEGYRFKTSLVYRLRREMGKKGKAPAKAVAATTSAEHVAARPSQDTPSNLKGLLDPIIAAAVQRAVDGYRQMLLGEDAHATKSKPDPKPKAETPAAATGTAAAAKPGRKRRKLRARRDPSAIAALVEQVFEVVAAQSGIQLGQIHKKLGGDKTAIANSLRRLKEAKRVTSTGERSKATWAASTGGATKAGKKSHKKK